jgi:RNA polymerase sigma-B factor
LGDIVADPVDHLAVAEDRAVLEPLLRQLSERDRRVLHLRFVEYRTQREIGEEFGVTQMQVSRWLTRIFAYLRERLTAARSPVAATGR